MQKIEELFRNILVWFYCLITVPTFGLMAIITKWHFWARAWCKGLLKILGIKIHVKGNLPPAGIYVFMSNHQSQLDIPVLEKILEPYNIRFLAKQSLFKIPFFGWGIKALGYVPVERENPKEGLKSILICIEKLKRGYSLVIFPEGTRSPTGELLPFKIGGFLVPLKSKVKIVPITIWGTRNILPKGKIWFNTKQKNVKVFIDRPVDVGTFTLREKNKLSSLVRNIILKNLELLKKEMEGN